MFSLYNLYIMDILNLIKTRRSIRRFKDEEIPKETILEILEAGRWAPSGLNNQPWRFMVLEKEKKDRIASYTHYSDIIKNANKIILVFLDKKSSYNLEKDLLAIGACIQNMLLYIHSINLGACWLGEILNKREEVKKELNIEKDLELEGVIAIGRPAICPKGPKRKEIKDLLIT